MGEGEVLRGMGGWGRVKCVEGMRGWGRVKC